MDGLHYHFTDKANFQAMVSEGMFAEWAHVHDNMYGTSVAEIDRARREGKRGIVFDIDYQGARQIKAALPEASSVFILPPSMPELKKRLELRGTETPESLERRYQKALVEIEHYGFFDYLIVNDNLEQAQQALLGIALAERHRRVRLAPLAERLLRHGSTRPGDVV